MTFRGSLPLAALTTIFTPPCPTSWLVTTSKVPSQFPSFPGAGPVPTCNPPAWQDNLSAEGFAFYSPAICPSGFEVGPNCILTSTPRTTEGFPAVAPGETVAWCVPSGQSCASDTTDFRGGYWGVTQTATETGALATVGPAMQIRFRDIDLSILETHPLTPGLTLAAIQTPPPSSSNGATTTSSPSQTSTPTSVSSTSTSAAQTRFQTTRGSLTTSTITFVSSGNTIVSTLTTAPARSTANGRPAPNAGNGNNNGNDDGDDDDNDGDNDDDDDDDDDGSSVTPANNGTDSDSDGSGTSTTATVTQNHTPYSHTRAFAATITMSCLIGVTAIGIASYFFISRRRRNRQNNLQAARDAEQGGSSGVGGNSSQGPASGGMAFFAKMLLSKPAATTTSNGDGNNIPPASAMSSVGVGAWIQRQTERRPRWQGPANKAKGWWAGLPFSKPRSPLTGDGQQREKRTLGAWAIRQRSQDKKQGDDEEQQTRGINAEPAASVPTPLPTLELNLGDEKFSHMRNDSSDSSDSNVSSNLAESEIGPMVDVYTIMPKTKGIPSQPRVDRTSARQSWMSRLSRYMRGDQARSPGTSGNSTPNTNRASSKASPTNAGSPFKFDFNTNRLVDQNGEQHKDDDDETATRWSRYTRADTLSIVTDGADYHGHQRGLSDPNCVKADSWEAFSRSHQGLGKILAAKKVQGSSRSPTTPSSPSSPQMPKGEMNAARIRMQSVAFGSGESGKDLPSPTMTVSSDRTGTQRGSRWLSVDSKHLSRFSDGTFGRMDSFVSKSSSPTSEMPPVREEGTEENKEKEKEKTKEKGIPSLDAW